MAKNLHYLRDSYRASCDDGSHQRCNYDIPTSRFWVHSNRPCSFRRGECTFSELAYIRVSQVEYLQRSCTDSQ